MDIPQTKYAKLGESHIAYQVFGEGPIDFLNCLGSASSVDLIWENPLAARFLTRLASIARVITFDRRGSGASDPVPLDALPTWEDWTEDLTVVLDAVGSERAAIRATVDAGPLAMLFAATYPERVSGLVLHNTTARYTAAPDYPIGMPSEQVDAIIAMIETGWGTEEFVAVGFPSLMDDPEFVRYVAKYFRSAATPRTAAAHFRYMFGLDARAVLPLIQAPTLVEHVSENPLLPIEHGRYLAENIAGARFVEIPGADLSPLVDARTADLLLDHVAEFVTGTRPISEPERVLATVLFTDVIGSTERAAELGDRRWKELLDRMDRVVHGEIERAGGRLVKTTGDGHLATFDGPGKAIRCARALIDGVKSLGVQIRAGLHTGEIELRGTDVGGIAVHIGARVASAAGPSEVLVSRTVTDLVAGSGIDFEDRGKHALKGVPGEWRLFAVRS